jgi:hypothetical protein
MAQLTSARPEDEDVGRKDLVERDHRRCGVAEDRHFERDPGRDLEGIFVTPNCIAFPEPPSWYRHRPPGGCPLCNSSRP